MTNGTREGLIGKIVERELEMFLAVRNRGGTSPCQELPGTFRIMREITHGVLSEAFLVSYLGDLEGARVAGRNLMTEKYALMETLIPPRGTDPRIGRIVAAEGEWRREVAARFPRTIHPDGHEGFCLYLGCELQTYSCATLEAYCACVETALDEGRNLVRERYELLLRKLDLGTLQDRETSCAGTCPHA